MSTAKREKTVLMMPTIQEEVEYEVSDVSAVVHPSQVNSQEAVDTFFDVLSLGEVDTESLVDAETF